MIIELCWFHWRSVRVTTSMQAMLMWVNYSYNIVLWKVTNTLLLLLGYHLPKKFIATQGRIILAGYSTLCPVQVPYPILWQTSGGWCVWCAVPFMVDDLCPSRQRLLPEGLRMCFALFSDNVCHGNLPSLCMMCCTLSHPLWISENRERKRVWVKSGGNSQILYYWELWVLYCQEVRVVSPFREIVAVNRCSN